MDWGTVRIALMTLIPLAIIVLYLLIKKDAIMITPNRVNWVELKSISGEVVVVCFDICSSSDILEELISKQIMEKYAAFVGLLKHHLVAAQQKVMFQPYKFTGDGWILIFPIKQYKNAPPAISGSLLLQFLNELCVFFNAEFQRQIMPYLDQPPSVTGLNFGISMGKLHQTTILGKREYLGRPIIVACRLQGEIKVVDDSPAYKALVPEDVFLHHLSAATNVESLIVNLRNIRGGKDFRCRKIGLSKG